MSDDGMSVFTEPEEEGVEDFVINFQNVVSDGIYDLKVVGVSAKKRGENLYRINFRYEVMDGENKGFTLFDGAAVPEGVYFLQQILEGITGTSWEGKKPKYSEAREETLGAEFRAHVIEEPHWDAERAQHGATVNRIESYYPSQDSSPEFGESEPETASDLTSWLS